MAIKWLLMLCWYSHRPKNHSILIRKGSSWNRCKLMQRSTAQKCTVSERLWLVSPKWIFSPNPLFLGSGIYAEEESSRLLESEVVDGSKETVFHRHMIGTHMNSKRQWQNNKTCTYKLYKIPALRKESGYKVPPLTKKIFIIDTCR